MRCFKIGEGVRDGFTRDMAMEELGGGGLMGSIWKEVRCCETGPGGRDDGRVIFRSFHGDPDCAPACSQRPR